MFISADTMALLVSKGLDGQDLVDVYRAIEADFRACQPVEAIKAADSAADRKRAADRERMREKRERENVARQSRDVACDNSDISLSLPLSPQTPQSPTHTRECVTTRTRKADADPEGFQAFWDAYPTSLGRKMAVKAYISARQRGVSLGTLVQAVERDKATQWRERPPDKIPHASTWLNQDRWLDEPPPNVTTLRPNHDRPSRQSVQLDERYENYRRALAGAEIAAQRGAVEPSGGF